MTTPPNEQRKSRLNRLHQLLESDVFDENRVDDGACERAFVEIIPLLDDVLMQSEAAGQRIDFTKEVGVNGKIQDITSLVHGLNEQLTAEKNALNTGSISQFNCYHNAGTGYFANGVFFTVDHDGEVAFFVDKQRIYLNRHIKRALQEAEYYLTKKSVPVTNL
ncbi:hypothetical protein GCM10027341_26560 [Spirosoma knui]